MGESVARMSGICLCLRVNGPTRAKTQSSSAGSKTGRVRVYSPGRLCVPGSLCEGKQPGPQAYQRCGFNTKPSVLGLCRAYYTGYTYIKRELSKEIGSCCCGSRLKLARQAGRLEAQMEVDIVVWSLRAGTGRFFCAATWRRNFVLLGGLFPRPSTDKTRPMHTEEENPLSS